MAMKSKSLLITGVTGMVGNNLLVHMKNNGLHHAFRIHILSRGKDNYDLRNRHECVKMFQNFRPTHIIHLAANAGGVAKNMAHGYDLFLDNIRINTNVLDCCRIFEVDKVVSCVSACVYGFPNNVTIDESRLHYSPPHESVEGYAYAKRMLEVQSRLLRRDYKINSVCLAPTNCYGPYGRFSEEKGHVVSSLIKKFMTAKKHGTSVEVWGDGSATRQFLYTRDLSEILLWALSSYNDEQMLNVGPPHTHSIKHLSTIIADTIGYTGQIIYNSSKPTGQKYRHVRVDRFSRAYPEFKFTPLEVGIRLTCERLWETKGYSWVSDPP